MQAVRFHETGGPDVLQLDEVAIPEPTGSEARVKVAATGVNFIDTYQRSGQYKVALPFTPGSEAAGVIDAVGDVSAAAALGLQVGQRVVAASGGGYAQYLVAPLGTLIPLPDGIDDQTAVALMVQGLTAHYLAVSTFPLSEKETVLIHAAAGGAGGLLVQIAKRAGAKVIATVGTQEKADDVRGLGADHVIIYTEEDFVPAVREYTGGAGVDVVYDSVGKTTFDGGLDCLRPCGLMVLWGQASGAVPPLDLQVLNAKGSLYVTRPSLGSYVRTREELLWRANDLFEWVQSGDLKVRIDKTFPLAQAADAHRYVEGRHTRGKVVLLP